MPIATLMFGDFLKRLTAPAPLIDADARLALGALLVRVAKSDDHFAAQEVEIIEQLLAKRYGINSAAAATLRTECETLEREAPDTVRFTRAIKAAVALEDRIAVIEDLWAVVLADGVRDAHENSLLRLIANLLGVSDMQSAKARQGVQAGQG